MLIEIAQGLNLLDLSNEATVKVFLLSDEDATLPKALGMRIPRLEIEVTRAVPDLLNSWRRGLIDMGLGRWSVRDDLRASVRSDGHRSSTS